MLKSIFVVLSSAAYSLAAFAQDAPVLTPGAGAAPAGAAPAWTNFLLLGGMILFMWFFVIRPQAKRQKEHKNFIDSLQTGMEVVTSSGLIGRITNVSENIVTVDLGNTAVRVLKSAISGKLDSKTLEAAAAK